MIQGTQVSLLELQLRMVHTLINAQQSDQAHSKPAGHIALINGTDLQSCHRLTMESTFGRTSGGPIRHLHQQSAAGAGRRACISSVRADEVGATSGEDDPGIRRIQHRPLPETHGRESLGHAAVPLVGLHRHWLLRRVEALDRPERGGQDKTLALTNFDMKRLQVPGTIYMGRQVCKYMGRQKSIENLEKPPTQSNR